MSALSLGLTLVLDYNEDRQTEFTDHGKVSKNFHDNTSFTEEMKDDNKDDQATIHIGTIGRIENLEKALFINLIFRTSCFTWRRRI